MNESHITAVVAVGVIAYIVIALRMSKMPDPMVAHNYGISVKPFLAGGVAFATALVCYLVVSISQQLGDERVGYVAFAGIVYIAWTKFARILDV